MSFLFIFFRRGMKKQISIMMPLLFFISSAIVGQKQPGLAAGELAKKKEEFMNYLKDKKWNDALILIQELKTRRQNAIATQWEVEYYKAGGPTTKEGVVKEGVIEEPGPKKAIITPAPTPKEIAPPVPPREEKKKDMRDIVPGGVKEGEAKIIDVGKEAEKSQRRARITHVLDKISDELAKKKAVIEVADRANKIKSAIDDAMKSIDMKPQDRKSKTDLLANELDALASSFSSSGDTKDADLIKELRNTIAQAGDSDKQKQSMSLGKDVLDKILKEQEAKHVDINKAFKDLDDLLAQQGELENRSNKELQDLIRWAQENQKNKNYDKKMIDELEQQIAKGKQKLQE